jgi:solute carrier family 25 carnitine/acylcarnitine transporter 20/29
MQKIIPQQYEGTLRLFAPTPVHPAPHPDSAVDDDTGDDALSHRPGPRVWAWAPPLVAGAAAGIIGWIATFPFDVLKTRLQAGAITGTGTADTVTPDTASGRLGLGSSWRTAHKMYAESGGRVFWRGLAPTLVRAVPVNMAVFGTFEGVIWAFSGV